jgi:hypothetical protein
MVSGSPNIRFMFWTAWPDAPFTRLSITESTTSVSEPFALCGGRWTADEARAAGDVGCDGDAELGGRVLASLAFTP